MRFLIWPENWWLCCRFRKRKFRKQLQRLTLSIFKRKRTTVIKKLLSGVEFLSRDAFILWSTYPRFGLFPCVFGYITFYEEYETSLTYFPLLPRCDVNRPCL